ncbi:MAG TPA: PIN domain-containing protein, partial [Blastocatellia bacterium]
MISGPSLLDTDILSLLMRGDPPVVAQATKYLAQYRRFTISVITRYEILRGLKVKGAAQQATRFDQFCAGNEVLPITEATIIQAADIYA